MNRKLAYLLITGLALQAGTASAETLTFNPPLVSGAALKTVVATCSRDLTIINDDGTATRSTLSIAGKLTGADCNAKLQTQAAAAVAALKEKQKPKKPAPAKPAPLPFPTGPRTGPYVPM